GDAARLHEWRAVLNTADIYPEKLEEATRGVDFDAVLIGSVVPAKAEVLANPFSRQHPVHMLDHRSPLGMGIDYPLPAQIGADRLANAVGVLHRHGAPAIVIDFGTAVTFDVISSAPAYCGGVIAPGLGAMSAYLPGKTALLPVIELEEPAAAIGKSTAQAMLAGAVYGYRGMIREIIARIRAELGGDPKIVATGGDAALIARGLKEIAAVDPDLTLDGLRRVAAAVFAGTCRRDWV
ncbi:MAG TPA: type III pantothenate kinase, partial [Luteolibacter sp.]|nr:type III pantothenate kinase [Luteolibacter sp.]